MRSEPPRPPRAISSRRRRASDVSSFAPAPRRSETPSLSPVQPPAGRGWLTDLLNRASRDETEPTREPPREPVRERRETRAAATNARRAIRSNRWIRSRSISPA